MVFDIIILPKNLTPPLSVNISYFIVDSIRFAAKKTKTRVYPNVLKILLRSPVLYFRGLSVKLPTPPTGAETSFCITFPMCFHRILFTAKKSLRYIINSSRN